MSSVDGYKTYIIAACTLLYALMGFITGNLDANTAIQLVLGSGAIATLRHAISKPPTA